MDSSIERYTITLDDDPNIKNTIEQATGIKSEYYSSGDELAAKSHDGSPLAVFVDARLSIGAESQSQLIPRLKDSWPLSPVILTTLDNDNDILTEAMALGADDFVGKPIEPGELNSRLSVRMAALAKRAARETIAVADLTIDTLQRSVSSARGQRYLSPTEIRLISELAKAGGNVVPRELLKTRCWPQQEVSDNALNRKLYEVRKRLKPLTDSIAIRTIYGVGFILEEKR